MSGRHGRLSARAASGLSALLLASCSNSSPVAPRPPEAIPSYSGIYTLTITAGETAGPCAPAFPLAARRRVYTARIQQRIVSERPHLDVFLSGADFIITRGEGNSFSGSVSSTGEIQFRIYDADPGDPWSPPAEAKFVERLSDGTHLVVVGFISARRTGGTISGQGGALRHSTGGQCAIDSFEMASSGGPGEGDWDY